MLGKPTPGEQRMARTPERQGAWTPEAGRGRRGGAVEGSVTAGAGGKEAGAREAVPGPPGY